MSLHYANLDAKTLRELIRKRKAEEEYEAMIDRFDEECGECITFKNEEEMNTYYKNREVKKGTVII